MITKNVKKKWSSLADTFCHVICSSFSSHPCDVVALVDVVDSSMAFRDGGEFTEGTGYSSEPFTSTRLEAFPFLLQHKPRLRTHWGGVPFMKKTLRTKMLPNRTKAMMIDVACKLMPRIGTPSDVSGRKDGISSKNTVMARSMVVTKPILSPLSTGMKNDVSVRVKSSVLGIVR